MLTRMRIRLRVRERWCVDEGDVWDEACLDIVSLARVIPDIEYLPDDVCGGAKVRTHANFILIFAL